MSYAFYYQDHDNKQGTWSRAEEEEFVKVRETCAFHVSPWMLLESKDKPTRFKGDFWIDIDHDDLNTSIEETRKVQKFLVVMGVDLSSCALFLSGGKGTHIRIPADVVGAGHSPTLPLVYKKLAKTIMTRTGVTGIDLQLYRIGGMGSLIRVENKLRKNGRYKVPFDWESLASLDVETYLNLCIAPRPLADLTPPVMCRGMVTLLNEANADYQQEERYKKEVKTNPEFLKELTVIPKCIKQIMNNENTRGVDAGFNKAKLTIARFVASCNLAEADKDIITDTFVKNYPSSRFPSEPERERELNAAMTWIESDEKDFSCGYALSLLNKRPCHGCSIKVSEMQVLEEDLKIEVIDNSYTRKPSGKRTEPLILSNFVLEPTKLSYEIDEDGRCSDQTYTFNIHYQNKTVRPTVCSIKIQDFLSVGAFRKSVVFHPQAKWIGKDEDVQELKVLVTSEEILRGVEKVIPTKKQGILRAVDILTGIDEYVWVQKGWSWNGSLPNTMEYQGAKQIGDSDTESNSTINLRHITAVETPLAKKVFGHLMQSRGKRELAMMLGWVGACWMKGRLQEGEYGAIFPVLHVYGTAGSGKTELTKTLAMLGGFDAETVNISNCTPYYLKAIATATTTIPQILDEANVTKITTPELVKAFREVIKSTATKQIMGKGKVIGGDTNGQVATEVTICTSPLVMLATAQTQERELIERSLIIFLNGKDILQDSGLGYLENFEAMSKARNELRIYTRILMEAAISLTNEQIQAWWEATEWVRPLIKIQRPQAGIRKVIMGLYFIIHAFEKAKCSKQTIVYVQEFLETGVKAYINDPVNYHLHDDGKTETDLVVDRIFGMAQLDDQRGAGNLLKETQHYIVDTSHVHLKINTIFLKYKPLAVEAGWVAEYDTAVGFIQALKNCDYYVGNGKVAGVPAPSEWHTLSIPKLIAKGIDLTRIGIVR